jgi:periplasmic divalent cation tolerance protein
MTDYCIITTTFPDNDSAKSAARLLVERRLAACVQLLPINSVYSWQGKVCDENEILLLIKTKAERFDEVVAAIKEVHTYDVPQIIQVPIVGGTAEYLEWIKDSVDVNKVKSNPDLDLMYRTANEFLTISYNGQTYIPNFVNKAFACELYIKFICYSKHKNYKQGHNLKTLYNNAVKIKAIDKQAFLPILADEISKGGVADETESIFANLKDDIEFAEQELNTILERHGTLFEDWRYAFEVEGQYDGNVNTWFISFARALKRYIETLNL